MANLKGASGIETFTLAWNTDLADLKTKVNKLDLDKLMVFPADLSKLINVVDNDVVTNVW